MINFLKSEKNQTVAILFLISIITFISFSSVLDNGFVNWDDPHHLRIKDGVNSLNISDTFDYFTNTTLEIYIPLTITSFAIEHHFFGYNPFVFHLNNLLLHIGVTLLIFSFLKKLGVSNIVAGSATLLFGIHPVHVESVAWITERKDVLYSLFYMLSLNCYCAYIKTKRWDLFRIAVICFILSMLSKPMALSLPLILLLCDFYYRRKLNFKLILEKIPFFIIAGSIGWISYSLHMRMPVTNIFKSALIWLWTLMFYPSKFLFPIQLTPVSYNPEPVSIIIPSYFSSLLCLLCILWLCFRIKNKKTIIFSLLYFLFSIFFLLRMDFNGQVNFIADHFMYLPMLGFCLIFGYITEGIYLYLRKLIIF